MNIRNNNINNNTDMTARNLIENQDILLSSAFNELSNNNDLHYDTYSFINGVISEGVSQSQTMSKIDIKDEIVDLNIFDLLQSEDPEMTTLLESINNGDIVGYLPQISVNSANKILDSATSNGSSNSISTLVKLDELIENNQENSDSFKDICDLLALNKSDIENIKSDVCDSNKILSITPPLTPDAMKPSRVSLRIKSRKQQMAIDEQNLNTNSIFLSNKNSKKQASIKQNNQNKRKLFCEDENLNENELIKKGRLLDTSNDNSVDSSQAAYLNDNTISFEQDYSNDIDFSLLANSNSNDDNSDENDFKDYLKRSNLIDNGRNRMSRTKERTLSETSSKNNGGCSNDPIKKESNKEAATRYRLKKLNEKDQLFETRVHLEKENDQVKKKIELVQTEINYLKMLLVQMLLSKGIVHSDLTKCY